ncbi:HD-GYP domain-containing protein [Aureliella helgolandensis]|uniref:Cyclic di-GMP phosphodiesterase response regulator RpfG n=1 Tax=Aureliella helgolandensis TaxID=2527968 RepID=A0A518G8H9_9BACT|nr:HD domain-containing phosphohydrolase [Aureliella helgolandensis]QDV24890.1 Cyclic di-GMP phosphodiesterase response regulator RpfG [Aureliella helgolandensis]
MIDTSRDSLIPISLATLSVDTALGIDIYLRSSVRDRPVLFCGGDDIPDRKRFARLCEDGDVRLFIDRNERPKYQAYLCENIDTLLENESSMSPLEQLSVLSEVMRDVLDEQFSKRDTGQIVTISQKLGECTSRVLSNQPPLTKQLCSVLHHDYATFTHSTNVSLYCSVLAKALGFSEQDISEVAAGGLLHDVGKLQIDPRILTKPDRLDEFEYREIQKHPTIGFCELREREDVTLAQLMMVYQHHERCDGSGYPVGITAEEIHPYSKVCSIVDVYEALTSHRPYRHPMTVSTALSVLERGGEREFDPEMLRCWRQLVTE